MSIYRALFGSAKCPHAHFWGPFWQLPLGCRRWEAGTPTPQEDLVISSSLRLGGKDNSLQYLAALDSRQVMLTETNYLGDCLPHDQCPAPLPAAPNPDPALLLGRFVNNLYMGMVNILPPVKQLLMEFVLLLLNEVYAVPTGAAPGRDPTPKEGGGGALRTPKLWATSDSVPRSAGFGSTKVGLGSPPPTAPQTVKHPLGSHIGWRRPPWQYP